MTAYEVLRAVSFETRPTHELPALAERASVELNAEFMRKLSALFDGEIPFRIIELKKASEMFFSATGAIVDDFVPFVEVDTIPGTTITSKIYVWSFDLALPPIERVAASLAGFVAALVGPAGDKVLFRVMCELRCEADFDRRKLFRRLRCRIGFDESTSFIHQCYDPREVLP